ncbi:3,4-dihydroxy-2-butanone-4-phosphate synthase [Streptomyces litchfieldiae]|uniref:3,4-dihydroxy-2-butanone-4-phosphate synthase n=1 Tax=Streptomyces litchfieldiae TaxID=3075543 RepID=A0ABU2MT69_9ACTN|nr:3,4-dihydroxy-2-butanone-4-phosphate synthase [Streptomyces sp. DSM 44938]MDT0344825.1 3,4-dihydroxy-2-butanone-4-phosphate synthase [Streptomyces sp. DSM 44938]
MFTGHIREIGTVVATGPGRIVVRSAAASPSVCVNGVALTATPVVGEDGVFQAAVSPDTRRRSTLGELRAGARVNVERPVALGEPLSGHLVQGNVDAVGKVMRIDDDGPMRRLWIKPPDRFLPLVPSKGQIAVDGVSLTVAETARDRFAVALVPATLNATTLQDLSVGDRVNLEPDLVVRLARWRASDPGRAVREVVAALPWAGRVSGGRGVQQAIAQLAAGGAVMLWDPDREAEGDVIFAGARLRPDAFTFLLTQVCGHPTVPCAPEVLDRLELERVPGPGDRHGTRPHIPVDLAGGTGTGVSAAERAATVRRLARPDARPADFLRPGHVFPLAARPGGLAERAGHTEATVALCVAAGLPPVGVCCEVMNPDGTMAQAADLEIAALRWGLPLLEMADLRTHL